MRMIAWSRAKQPRPSFIEFLSDPAQAVAPEVELDLGRGRPDRAAREGEFLTAKERVAQASKRAGRRANRGRCACDRGIEKSFSEGSA